MDTEEKASEIAKFITETLMSDEIVPSLFASNLDDRLGIFNGSLKRSIQTLWAQKNNNLDPGRQRDVRLPLRLIKTANRSTPEDQLRLFLPEEKIIFNQKIFRSILETVNFGNLSAPLEKQVISRLKTEAIGLSDQEVLIYYNLIKWSSRGNQSSSSSSAQAEEENEEENYQLYAASVVENVDKQLVSMDRLILHNENRRISQDLLIHSVVNKVESQRFSMKVARVISGSYNENKVFVNLIKSYLTLVSDDWGVQYDETVAYFTIYMLLSGADAQIIKSDQVSRTYQKFLLTGATRLKSAIIANIKFLYLFVTILASQIIEINKKFVSCPQEQQEKLIKLYASQERQAMIVNNASNFALKKVECPRSDLFDVSKHIKSFLGKHPNILNTDILFRAKY
ncbi:MAG: hypothetical protein AAF518_09410 [Spirochaetota bacterium]